MSDSDSFDPVSGKPTYDPWGWEMIATILATWSIIALAYWAIRTACRAWGMWG